MKGFYSTYEELKLLKVIIEMKIIIVFTVPMRNWNNHAHYFRTGSNFVFTVPMRNWNLYVPFFDTTPYGRFYSTYEELKRLKSTSTLSNFFVFTVPMRNWNICAWDEVQNEFNVFTVPMRNWNLGAKNQKLEKIIVFTVPMRNWNEN